MSAPPRSRTAPARPPDGFPFRYRRYRSYLLFGASGVSMLIGCAGLLVGLRALGRGEQAWQGYLAALAPPGALAITGLLLLHTLYFAIRFAWVGRKIPARRIGALRLGSPRAQLMLGVLPIAGFASVWLILVLVLGGALP